MTAPSATEMLLWQVAVAASEFVQNEEGNQPRLGARWYALSDALQRLEEKFPPFAPEPAASDPRPDPRTHPEFWTE